MTFFRSYCPADYQKSAIILNFYYKLLEGPNYDLRLFRAFNLIFFF